MKKISKLLMALVIMLAGFNIVSTSTAKAALPVTQAIAEGATGSYGANGAYLKSYVDYTRGYTDIEDYFMNVTSAQAAATKLGFSYTDFLKWTAIGFIPYVGPFAAITSGITDAGANQAGKEIRALTDKGKKVQLTIIKDNGITYHLVREWSGSTSAIKPYNFYPTLVEVETRRIYK